MENNIFAYDYEELQKQRTRLKGHLPLVVWLTGLSGSGKSTIAKALELQLNSNGIHTTTLDGDNLRTGLNSGLGFSTLDRQENLRRVAEVAKIMMESGLVVLAAFVSPLQAQREQVKQLVGADKFVEIFIDTPLSVCEERDVKGLYQKARAGIIKDFTGINAPYEAPKHPLLRIATSELSVDQAVAMIEKEVRLKIKI
jgi:adenylylsulfate kinase